MLIRVISDVHNEFGTLLLPAMPDDKDTVLVIAGDLDAGHRSQYLSEYLIECSTKFRAIVYVPGNHEYYNGCIGETLELIKYDCSIYKNIHILDDDYCVIGNTAFIGATLWTSFDNGNPLVMEQARRGMNDFNVIHIEDVCSRFGSRTVRPDEIYSMYLESKDYIFNAIKLLKLTCNKVVVVSHHAPSFQSIEKKYIGNSLNGAFASNLDYDILNSEPYVWIHGHTHNSSDYQIGETRVICNPRGYQGYELNKFFDPYFRIEIGQ